MQQSKEKEKEKEKEKKNRVPILRERLNELLGDMTTIDFAEKVGISRQTMGFYLNGNRIPDSETLIKICNACNVSADWLLGFSDDRLRTPSAVDDLGLSESVVNRLARIHADAQQEIKAIPDITDWIDEEPGQYSGSATLDGINLFLENTLNTIFYQDVSSLHRAVQTEMRGCSDFVPHNPDDLYVRAQRGKTEAERYIGKLMERELGTAYPSQAGRFYVTYGLRRLTQKARDLTDDFRELLEAMVGIDAYKQMEHKECHD